MTKNQEITSALRRHLVKFKAQTLFSVTQRASASANRPRPGIETYSFW